MLLIRSYIAIIRYDRLIGIGYYNQRYCYNYNAVTGTEIALLVKIETDRSWSSDGCNNTRITYTVARTVYVHTCMHSEDEFISCTHAICVVLKVKYTFIKNGRMLNEND
jgi:hypothetical protein